MLPTLRQLQYLKLLHETGSFSRAAEAAHVTQPTLSAGIQEIERVLGARLVDRNRSGIILTAAGGEVVARAGTILAQVEDLAALARSAGRPLCGRFRLGVIPTVAPFLLPRTLPGLKEEYPHLRLYLREDLTHRLIADLRSGALDAILVALPYETTGLHWAHVADDEILAAFAAGNPIGDDAAVAPERLQGEELILLEDGHCLRDHVLAACGLQAAGRSREDGFAATSLATMIEMVGLGLGVSFLPAMAVAAGLHQSAGVEVRPLASALARREIVVAWRAGSPRGLEGRLLAEAFGGARAGDLPPSRRPSGASSPANRIDGHGQQEGDQRHCDEPGGDAYDP